MLSDYLPKLIDLFKDKVDWKFFNYIIDRSFEFSDKYDVTFRFYICVNDGRFSKFFIYFPDLEDNGDFIVDDSMEEYIDNYKKSGIYYKIVAYSDGTHYNRKVMDEYYEKIKNKCIDSRTDFSIQLSSIIVKPLN